MRYNHHTRDNGFTLIELVLYVSLVALLVVGVSAFFSIIKQVGVKNKAISAVEEQGSFAADILSAHIRSAAGVCPPGDGSGATLDLDSNCDVHTGSEAAFALDGDALVMTEGGVATPLTDSRVTVSAVNFSYKTVSGSANINYTFTIQAASYGATSEYRYSKTFTGGGTLRVQ